MQGRPHKKTSWTGKSCQQNQSHSLSHREHAFYTAISVQISKAFSYNTHFQVSYSQDWFTLWLLMPNPKMQTFVLFSQCFWQVNHLKNDNLSLLSDWESVFPHAADQGLWEMNSGQFHCDNYMCELAGWNSGVWFHPDSDAEAASSDREAGWENVFSHSSLCAVTLLQPLQQFCHFLSL